MHQKYFSSQDITAMTGQKYLSCKDIAAITGMKIKTVWGWCNSGKLRASKPGGRDYIITEADFLEFMGGPKRRKSNKKTNKKSNKKTN